MKMVGWVLGFLFAVTSIGVGCLPHSCTDIGCVGGDVAVALVDDSGAPVAARGEVRRSAHREVTFDCTVASSGGGAEADCVNNVLQLDPVNGNRETTELRFRLQGILDALSDAGRPAPLFVLDDFEQNQPDAADGDLRLAPHAADVLRALLRRWSTPASGAR